MVGSLLKKVGEVYKLMSDPTVKESYQMRTIDIIALMDEPVKEEASEKVIRSTKYVHKQHKFRVQALVIRRLKREKTGNLGEFMKSIIGHF